MLTIERYGDLLEGLGAVSSLTGVGDLLGRMRVELHWDGFFYAVRFPPGTLAHLPPGEGGPPATPAPTRALAASVNGGTVVRIPPHPYLLLNDWSPQRFDRFLAQQPTPLEGVAGSAGESPPPAPALAGEWPWFVALWHGSGGQEECGLAGQWLHLEPGKGLTVGFLGRRGEAGRLHLEGSVLQGFPLAPGQLMVALLRGILPCFHQRAMTLAGWYGTEAPPPPLSPRERECLRWAAEGKTAWEIGEILRITERTVVAHLKNASAKLEAGNRLHAVSKAILLGLL